MPARPHPAAPVAAERTRCRRRVAATKPPTPFTPFYAVSAGESAGTGFATFGDFVPQTVQQVFGPVPPFSYFRVQPLGVGSAGGVPVGVLRVDYLTLWNRDDGLDVGDSCVAGLVLTLGLIGLGASAILDGLAGHQLDNERSAALVAAPAAYSAYSYYTSAHEGTFTDHSEFLTPSQPVPAGNHLILALSRSKHATYSFNPDGMPLIPGPIIDAVFSTIDFLYAIGEIDFYTWLIYNGIAYSVFFECIIEHFQDQGGSYAATRVNVGEPNQPINGSGFIQDTELYGKLTTPLWLWPPAPARA